MVIDQTNLYEKFSPNFLKGNYVFLTSARVGKWISRLLTK